MGILFPVTYKCKLEQVTVQEFICCLVHKDYKKLLISGRYSKETAYRAWLNIAGLYYESMSGVKSKAYIKLLKDTIRLWIRYERVAKNIVAYRLVQAPEIALEFKADGYNFKFTPKTYIKDLERIETAEQRIKSMYEQKNKQLKEFNKDSSEPTEMDIMDNVAELRKFGNYQDAPEVLAVKWSLATYCLEMVRYNRHIESIKKQQEELTNKRKGKNARTTR